MKKSVIAFPLFILSLTSCGGSENKSTNTVEISNNVEDTVKKYPFYTIDEEGNETYEFEDYILTIKQDGSSDCDGNKTGYEKEDIMPMEADTSVEKRGDSLVLKFYGGSELAFVDNISEDDYMMTYSYMETLDQIEYWVVYGYGYEYFETYLVDKFSKSKTVTVGRPYVSPEKRFVVVGNSDMHANFTENHLTLYNWDSEGVHLAAKLELDTAGWSPIEIKWVDDFHLIVKQGRLDEETYNIVTNCAEVTIAYNKKKE